VWKSWETQKLDIRDIAWPGNSHAPPQGVPEKFHLKITFLEEAPYINLSPADPVSGKCLMDRGVLCRVAADHEMAADIDVGQAHRNESFYQCCSGFCIDLLEKFAEELGFTYELVRVEDGKWGTLENGKWNGLIADPHRPFSAGRRVSSCGVIWRGCDARVLGASPAANSQLLLS